MWLELPPGRESPSVTNEAERAGVALSSGVDFALRAEEGLRFVRVSLGGERDDERLVSGLRAARHVISL